jgi:hypothetical protein
MEYLGKKFTQEELEDILKQLSDLGNVHLLENEDKIYL